LVVTSVTVLAAAAPAPVSAAPPRGEVTVVNDETTPVPVKNVAEERREPFQAQLNFTIPSGFVIHGDGVRVPPGKRFVVEYASVWVRDFPTRTVVQAYAETTSGTGPVRHRFLTARTGLDSGPAAITIGGQQMRLYGNADTFVSIYVEVGDAGGGTVVQGSLSGYLVDVP
jgi:hypothetical protein